MVADRRSEAKDPTVIASAQSHLFSNSNAGLPAFTQIIESSLVVDSKYCHGVQVAEIVCGILGGLFRRRRDGRNARVERRRGNGGHHQGYSPPRHGGL